MWSRVTSRVTRNHNKPHDSDTYRWGIPQNAWFLLLIGRMTNNIGYRGEASPSLPQKLNARCHSTLGVRSYWSVKSWFHRSYGVRLRRKKIARNLRKGRASSILIQYALHSSFKTAGPFLECSVHRRLSAVSETEDGSGGVSRYMSQVLPLSHTAWRPRGPPRPPPIPTHY